MLIPDISSLDIWNEALKKKFFFLLSWDEGKHCLEPVQEEEISFQVAEQQI
jgi:hypothetical protein